MTAEPMASVPEPDEAGSASLDPPEEIRGVVSPEGPGALDALLDVSLPVVIEVGRTSMTLSEVLELTPGSLVQLDNLVGDPASIQVGDRKIAEGEVVVVGDHFGVRITRMLSPAAGARR